VICSPVGLARRQAGLARVRHGRAGDRDIARRLAAGETVRDLRDLRGIAYALGAKESA